MSAVSAPTQARPALAMPRPGAAVWRLLRLELRRSPMLWMLPLAVALFWYDAYRSSMAMPPMWDLRAMTMQRAALVNFLPAVVGAAGWAGSRDGRRRIADLVAVTARPRWTRQLAAWAAVTCWAMVAYLGCVGVLYLAIARQAAWGGPLWWPAAVGAAGIPALSAVGFAAGAFFPSRSTAPLITVGTFFVFAVSAPLAHGGKSLGQISPLIVGAVDVGPDSGVATFYHYLPDLSIAQMMFLAGLSVAVLGAMGLPGRSGGRRLRRSAAGITVAGLLAAGAAFALVDTARLDVHGMMIIPALHDAANDRPIRYTPVCSHTAIPVCLNPAYQAYLPLVAAALEPVLSEVAGLPGAPTRVSQAAQTYQQEPANGISNGATGPLVLPDLLPGERDPVVTSGEFAAQVRSDAANMIVDAVVGGSGGFVVRARDGRVPARSVQAMQARVAVAVALLADAGAPLQRDRGGVNVATGVTGLGPSPGNAVPGPVPGSPVYVAARRFAALPAAVQHAWLVTHLAALRAGHITLAQLP